MEWRQRLTGIFIQKIEKKNRSEKESKAERGKIETHDTCRLMSLEMFYLMCNIYVDLE